MRISILKNLTKRIKKFLTRKERFLFACAYNFYIQQAQIELGKVNLLPFIDAQNRHNWAKAQAKNFVQFCKNNNIINERYKLALQYAKSL